MKSIVESRANAFRRGCTTLNHMSVAPPRCQNIATHTVVQGTPDILLSTGEQHSECLVRIHLPRIESNNPGVSGLLMLLDLDMAERYRQDQLSRSQALP